MTTLDEILDLLGRHRQRATYGAIGAVVGRPARYLTAGWPRDYRHSWVVSQATGLPTGYGPADMHPELRSHSQVLRTGRELEEWLRDRRASAGRERLA